MNCVDLGSPCPFDETKQRPVGIDPKKGIGTAYEGKFALILIIIIRIIILYYVNSRLC